MDFPPDYNFDFNLNDFQDEILDSYSFELSDIDLLNSIENLDPNQIHSQAEKKDTSSDGPGRFVTLSEEDLTAIVDNAQSAGTKKKYEMDHQDNRG